MANRDLKIAFDKVKFGALNKVNKILNSSFMNKVGKELAEDIVRRTRTGQGSTQKEGKKQKLKKLKESTIKQRKRFKKKGLLSSLTTPRKSNLTMTGQLLDSLESKSRKSREIRLEFKGTHKGSKIKNSELAAYMEDGDRARNRPPRPFLTPTSLEKKRLIDNIVDKLRKSV